jgi:hypothetical protein
MDRNKEGNNRRIMRGAHQYLQVIRKTSDFSWYTKARINTHAPSRKRQIAALIIAVRFTGHNRAVTLQYRTCFMSSLGLEFGDVSLVFWKICGFLVRSAIKSRKMWHNT